MKVAAVMREDVDTFKHDVALGKTAATSKTNNKRGLARVRGGKGAASRAVGLLGGIFTYAMRHRMRPDNPVHGLTRFADSKRDRRLSDNEYEALGEALRQAEASNVWPAAIAVTRFLALTGWRAKPDFSADGHFPDSFHICVVQTQTQASVPVRRGRRALRLLFSTLGRKGLLTFGA
jgi:hypothetical protein